MTYKEKEMNFGRKAPTRCPICGFGIRKGDRCVREQTLDDRDKVRKTRYFHVDCFDSTGWGEHRRTA